MGRLDSGLLFARGIARDFSRGDICSVVARER